MKPELSFSCPLLWQISLKHRLHAIGNQFFYIWRNILYLNYVMWLLIRMFFERFSLSFILSDIIYHIYSTSIGSLLAILVSMIIVHVLLAHIFLARFSLCVYILHRHSLVVTNSDEDKICLKVKTNGFTSFPQVKTRCNSLFLIFFFSIPSISLFRSHLKKVEIITSKK